MNNKNTDIKNKESKPVVAICYDFDNTLSPTNMQEGFIKSMGEDPATFWNKSNTFAIENKMDINLSYMYNMKELSEGKEVFTKKVLKEYGYQIELYPGLDTWFKRINDFGKENNVIVEHYIISSGLREMIEGCPISNEFKKIYASSFYYNEKGVATWPAQNINYTNKTQFLFRIEKGILDITNPAVNKKCNDCELRVPFTNMVYIGDSATDIPCMKLVNQNGGYSIGIYDKEKNDKTNVFEMINDGRISYYAPSDYTKNSELEILIKDIINNVKTKSILTKSNNKYMSESSENTKNSTTDIDYLIKELRTTDDYSYYVYCMSKLNISECDNDELKELLIAFNSNPLFSYSLKLNGTKQLVENVINLYGKDDTVTKRIYNQLVCIKSN